MKFTEHDLEVYYLSYKVSPQKPEKKNKTSKFGGKGKKETEDPVSELIPHFSQ